MNQVEYLCNYPRTDISLHVAYAPSDFRKAIKGMNVKIKVALACITTLVLSGCGGGNSGDNNITATNSEPASSRISKKLVDFDNDGVPEFETLYTYNSDGYITSELTRRLTTDKDLSYGSLNTKQETFEVVTNFDDQNFPTYIEELIDGVSRSKAVFTLNSSNRIGDIVEGDKTYRFFYDSEGKAQKVELYDSDNNVSDTYTYTYNELSQLTKTQSNNINFDFNWNKNNLVSELHLSVNTNHLKVSQDKYYTYESGRLKTESIDSSTSLGSQKTEKYSTLVEFIIDEKTGKTVGERRTSRDEKGDINSPFSFETSYETEEGECMEVGRLHSQLYKSPNKSGKTTQLLNNCSL
ncbi:hypothetical protein VIBNISOn1_1550026 [Vibrio nigripulchritudo SOn1]|uniref:YD repeat-containing protein n=1 Tax=Vibrio nigripulchritudo SOn1 TaxID=1238450 RepID=A0AAV2VM91_9VIBR|nr:hypothetical protein VIBNISOn1_1550026 [Vibrio nigripulchritudo SOn1]